MLQPMLYCCERYTGVAGAALDQLTISIVDAAASSTVALFDAQGRQVPITPQCLGDRFVFEVRGLSAGAYVVLASDGRSLRVIDP